MDIDAKKKIVFQTGSCQIIQLSSLGGVPITRTGDLTFGRVPSAVVFILMFHTYDDFKQCSRATCSISVAVQHHGMLSRSAETKTARYGTASDTSAGRTHQEGIR